MENVKYFVQILVGSRLVVIALTTLVGTLTILFAWQFFYGFPGDDAASQNVVVAKPLLTPEEVEDRRIELPVVTPTVASTTETERVPASAVTYVPAPENGSTLPVATDDGSAAEAPRPEVPKEPVFTTTGSGISVGTPVVTSPSSAGATEARTINGTVVGIDTAENLIMVVGNGGATRVTLQSDARITVDGERTSVDALAINDTVTVEGVGPVGGDELTAQSVRITGTFTIVPF